MEQLSYTIYSLSGKNIGPSENEKMAQLGKSAFINLSQLKNGFYIIEVSDDSGKLFRQKFQVLR